MAKVSAGLKKFEIFDIIHNMQSVNTDQQVQTTTLKRSRRKIVAIILLLFLAFIGMMLLVAFILFPFIRVLSGASAQTMAAPIVQVVDESALVSSSVGHTFPSVAFDQTFSSAAVSWEQDSLDARIAFFLRSSGDGKTWSDWYEAETFFTNNTTVYSEMTLLSDSSRYLQVRAETEEGGMNSATVSNIHLNIFPDYQESLATKMIRSIARGFPVFEALAQTSDLQIISRSGWSANEDWRFCTSWDSTKNTCKTKSAEPKWPSQVVPVKKFVIHHTGGSNQSGVDPKDAVRNIYYWHAIGMGWGDIGYNYLIDQQGNIYEGRFGGDGAQAGHTFNGPFCKRIGTAGQTSKPCSAANGDVETGYQMNAGTVGIAVLGDYNIEQPNDNIKAAIAKLIHAKADTSSLDLTQNIDWRVPLQVNKPEAMAAETWQNAVRDSGVLLLNKGLTFEYDFADPANPAVTIRNLPSIITHRDLDQTSCPGDNFYAQLEQIRALSRSSTSLEYEARFAGSSFSPAMHVTKSTRREITITNNGSRTWAKGDVELRIFDDGRKPSLFRDSTWKDAAGKFTFNETQVAPQGTATFTFTLKAPQYAGLYQHVFGLFRTSGEEIFGASFDRYVRVDEVYQGEIISSSLPVAVRTAWRPTVTYRFKNTSLNTWSPNTVLEIYNENRTRSAFASSTWNGVVASRLGTSVRTGQTATFTVRMEVPDTTGTYRQILKLKDGNKEIWLMVPDVSILTRVDP